MSEMSRHVTEQAVEWIHTLRQPAPGQEEAFVDWVRASPENLEAFLATMTLNQELADADWDAMTGVERVLSEAASNVVRLPHMSEEPHLSPALSAPGTGRRGHKKIFGFAAAAAVVVSSGLAWWLTVGQGTTYSTDIGEQKTVELADKSIVSLNSASEVELNFSSQARDITLQGEAMFKVQHDEVRPFRVRIGNAVIQAVGTQFNVRRLPSSTTVAVVEGSVQVRGSGEQLLKAGEEARIDNEGRVEKRLFAEASTAAAWPRQRLVFRDNTLEDITAEFNRWNRKQIHIENGAGAGQLYDGAFDADDPKSLIEFLRRMPGLSVENKGDRLVIHAK